MLRGMAQFIMFLVIALAMVIGMVIWRGRQIGALARDGVEVTATVVSKFRTHAGGPGSRGHRIAFTYRGPDGQEYRRAATVTRSQWLALEEGHALPIILLPAKPGISAPADVVGHAREALRKAGRL